MGGTMVKVRYYDCLQSTLPIKEVECEKVEIMLYRPKVIRGKLKSPMARVTGKKAEVSVFLEEGIAFVNAKYFSIMRWDRIKCLGVKNGFERSNKIVERR